MNRRLTISGLTGAANFFVVLAVFDLVRYHSVTLSHIGKNFLPGYAALIYGVLFGVIGALVSFFVWPALREPSDPD